MNYNKFWTCSTQSTDHVRVVKFLRITVHKRTVHTPLCSDGDTRGNYDVDILPALVTFLAVHSEGITTTDINKNFSFDSSLTFHSRAAVIKPSCEQKGVHGQLLNTQHQGPCIKTFKKLLLKQEFYKSKAKLALELCETLSHRLSGHPELGSTVLDIFKYVRKQTLIQPTGTTTY